MSLNICGEEVRNVVDLFVKVYCLQVYEDYGYNEILGYLNFVSLLSSLFGEDDFPMGEGPREIYDISIFMLYRN